MAKRFDRMRMDKGELTPQGFLRAECYYTRTGIFVYKRADGSIYRELRHPDDVFDQKSLDSLKAAPVTLDHPKEFVNAKNAKQYTVGYLMDDVEKKEDKFLGGTLIVMDQDAITSGKEEVSCGYEADIIEEPGVWEGEPYDARQTNIIYNHVALVSKGRAGPMARLRLDSEGEQLEETVEKILVNGVEFEVTPELAAAFKAEVEKWEQKVSEAEPSLDAKKEAEDAKKEVETLQAKVDSLEEQLKAKKEDTGVDIPALVRESMRIHKIAEKVLGTEEKLDSMSNTDIMKKVVAKRSPSLDLAKKSEAYITARFDMIEEEIGNGTDIGKDLLNHRKDGEKDIIEEAKAKAREDALNAWRTK